MKIIFEKGLQCWFPYYLWKKIFPKEKSDSGQAIDLFVCVVDHFEPFQSDVDFVTAKKRVRAWVEGYPSMAEKHHDADGRPPQHTWFYPPHADTVFLLDLVQLCKSGYGEIEMHLHHNRMKPFPDTPDTLREKIKKCIKEYSELGIFCLPNGKRKFAFIHGDWSLDNSLGNKICGVNNELLILKECGCYADFTFPSLSNAQPSMANTLFYAKDNPKRPKSYSWGRPIRVGERTWGDLIIIQGIIGLRWKSRTHRYRPSIEASNLSEYDYPFPKRIDYWIKNAISVIGKPNWLFIKLHTHGCREEDFDCQFGPYADEMYGYLEKMYNDGEKYHLHYVTAREMYNIIKAAEAGVTGSPNEHRNFEIQRYIYLKE